MPPISAQRATEVAGAALLKHLQANSKPPQDVSVPDALLRRRFDKPQEGIRKTVWVVLYRRDCPGLSGSSCNDFNSYFVDDQTGEIVGGLGHEN